MMPVLGTRLVPQYIAAEGICGIRGMNLSEIGLEASSLRVASASPDPGTGTPETIPHDEYMGDTECACCQ